MRTHRHKYIGSSLACEKDKVDITAVALQRYGLVVPLISANHTAPQLSPVISTDLTDVKHNGYLVILNFDVTTYHGPFNSVHLRTLDRTQGVTST